uniref:Blastocyst protein 4 n=1 Tax=Oryctolagus cuniculus TaxID=9986 RepID=BCP4_RABIT|nr:RecName: Full=Blastocyst protein 4; Flags: Precursor [Oryctolagus cuniculus]AAA31170.1 blastocyst protein 4 [Oryctolagus cuniculus]
MGAVFAIIGGFALDSPILRLYLDQLSLNHFTDIVGATKVSSLNIPWPLRIPRRIRLPGRLYNMKYCFINRLIHFPNCRNSNNFYNSEKPSPQNEK